MEIDGKFHGSRVKKQSVWEADATRAGIRSSPTCNLRWEFGITCLMRNPKTTVTAQTFHPSFRCSTQGSTLTTTSRQRSPTRL